MLFNSLTLRKLDSCQLKAVTKRQAGMVRYWHIFKRIGYHVTKNRILSFVYAGKTIKFYYEDLLEIPFEPANEKSNLNIPRLNQLGIESHEVSTAYKDRDFDMTNDLFQDQIAIEVVNIS